MKSSNVNVITWRSIMLGILLIPVNCYWIIQKQTWAVLGPPDTLSLFYNVIFILLILIIFNWFLKRFIPSLALTQGELLVVYTMLSIVTALGGIDLMQLLPPIMGYGFWFATPENEWKNLFWQDTPKWLTVSDKSVLGDYYETESTLYTASHIKSWFFPVFWWTIFLFVLVFVMLCINVILRKQWTENEKLTYPIIQLPLEMTRDGTGKGFFNNKILWMGFAVAGGIDLINGLHYLIPAVPIIPASRTGISWSDTFEIGHFFTERPFSAIGWTPLCFYPFAIGLVFLMPLDLSFSCWFFYFLRKIQLISGDIFGFQSLPQFPYLKPQASGGYIGLCVIALFQSRRYLFSVLKNAFTNTKDDADEPMRYKWAILGIVGGIAFLVLFSYKAGMSIWIAIIYFIIYFIISIAITRIRAELGPPAHELEYGGPNELMTDFIGLRRLGARNLTVFTIYLFFNRCYRSHPMPHQLEGFKLSKQTGMENRRLLFAMLLSAAIGIPMLFWLMLSVGYNVDGAPGSWASSGAFGRLQSWVNNPKGSNSPSVIFTFVGFGVTLILSALRMRFIWWKLHPVGYPLSTSWTMNMIWFSVLLSWAIKAIILKHGGIKVYRKAVPFFLGLILGEFIVGGLWNIVGQVFHVTTYVFWH